MKNEWNKRSSSIQMCIRDRKSLHRMCWSSAVELPAVMRHWLSQSKTRSLRSVSYTHLDVYKRQTFWRIWKQEVQRVSVCVHFLTNRNAELDLYKRQLEYRLSSGWSACPGLKERMQWYLFSGHGQFPLSRSCLLYTSKSTGDDGYFKRSGNPGTADRILPWGL